MNGLLLVNKPKGITSFDIIRQLRRVTGVRKIGHAGTLDPMATGLMLMLFGSACKSADQFSKLDKAYAAQITLGASSTTGDAEGQITPTATRMSPDAFQPALDKVGEALSGFIGKITQTPSIYSAIKINGQEAYKHARAGREVVMPSREVTIYSIVLTEYNYPLLNLEATVSSGTYIRSLAEDIGEKLGTGAYLSGLVRTKVGEFELEQAADLDGIVNQVIEQKLIKL